MHNYRIHLLDEHRIVYSHDVVFNENVFPFADPTLHPRYQSLFHLSNTDILEEENEVLDYEELAPSTPVHPLSQDEDLSLDPGPAELDITTLVQPHSPVPDSSIIDSSTDEIITPPTLVTPSLAPKNISSTIDSSNILTHKRRAAVARCDSSQP